MEEKYQNEQISHQKQWRPGGITLSFSSAKRKELFNLEKKIYFRNEEEIKIF